MATLKKKESSLKEYMKKQAQEWEDSIVKRKWAIKEYRRPEYRSFPDSNDPGVNRVVSPEFDTQEEAWDWAENYEPAKDTEFGIARIDYRQISYVQRYVF